ncbi:MAG: GAF domain-containing sensor histidine kinase [Armatimonadetes bacterium]|nr:GAF domain-containing sensor histidine kinase [Armatimonadota bacterium]MDE2207024.1 GAF domain-containing sensor histidine kinase [Armatimonadota bacterium]
MLSEPPGSDTGSRLLQQVLALAALLNDCQDLQSVLDAAIVAAAETAGAERGFVLILDPATRRVESFATHNIARETLTSSLSQPDGDNPAEISRYSVDTVLESLQPLIATNAFEDPTLGARESIRLGHLRSVLSVPLILRGTLLGVIYLDSRIQSTVFSADQSTALAAVANQVAISTHNARLQQELRRQSDERLRLQDELHQHETRRMALEQANQLKSDFVAFLAHELRNPLTAIHGAADTLRTLDPAESNRREWYDTIAVESGRIQETIEELLDEARLDAGKDLAIRRVPVHIRDIVAEQITRRRHDKAYTAGHTLQVDIDPETPEEIQSDPEKLHHILGNLIANAIKYSPGGGAVKIEVAPVPPNMLRLAVSDHGLGIAADKMERLFCKYDRLDRESIQHIPGTGLGLYFTRQLVDLMGGSVDCESEEGRGSTFTVRLPIDASP